MPLDRVEHRSERAQHVRPDRLEFERPGQADDLQLIGRDREMVRPEMHQPLDERRIGRQRAGRARTDRRGIIATPGALRELSRLLHRIVGCGLRRHRCHTPLHHLRRRCRRGNRRLSALLKPQCALLAEIIGELGRDRGAARRIGDDVGARIVTLQLLRQPPDRVARHRLIAARPEPEPVEGYTCLAHRARPLHRIVATLCARFVARLCPVRHFVEDFARLVARQKPSGKSIGPIASQ